MLLEEALIIFLKYPEPGEVKTRLAREIGNYSAALFYRLFSEVVLKETSPCGFSRAIFFHPKEKEREIREWLGSDLEFYPQEGKDLGERLFKAFEVVFKKGANRAVAIGTDSPTIRKSVIIEAFQMLKDRPCVLGPALDGGYYLLGLNSLHREIFKGISWGKHSVLERTQQRLRRLGLRFSLVEPCPDVDTLKDLCLLK